MSRLRVQLSILYLLVALVFLVAVVGLSYHRSVVAMRKEMTTSNEKLASLLSAQVGKYFERVNNVFFQFCLNSELIGLLNEWRVTDDPPRKHLLRTSILNNQLFELVHMLPSVYSIAYYDDRTRVVLVRNRQRGVYYSDMSQVPREWLREVVQKAKAKPGNLVYCPPHLYAPLGTLPDSSALVITFAKEVRNPWRLREMLGVVVVSIDLSELDQIVRDVRPSSSAECVVLDPDGRIVFSTNGSLSEIGGRLWRNVKDEDRSATVRLTTGDYVAFGRDDPGGGWSSRILVPEREMYAASRRILRQNFVILAIVSVIAFAGISTISYGVSRPIEEITERFLRMAEGDLNQEVESRRCDEVGRLSLAFNELARRMRTLIYQEYESRLKEQDAQLKALQFQMDPHCIYNSLQLISSLATLKGADDIRRIACGLGNLIRYTMDTRNSVVTLREEIEYVADYLGILKMRYGERLAFEIDVEEDLKDVSLLKLTLQPVVENAIVHGMRNETEERMRIAVTGYRSGEYGVLEVADNGRGIDPARLSEIRMALEGYTTGLHTRDDNLGLKNLLARLKLFYQGGARLAIESEEGRGTRVTLVIPIVHLEEGAQD